MAEVLEPFNQVLFSIAGAPTTLGELLGFVTGAAAVWLVVRQNVWTFPVGIANAVFFGLLFMDARLYADAALQVLYVVLQVLGWWAWLRLGPDRGELRVSRGRRAFLAAAAATVLVAALLGPFLASLGDSAPALDATTTSLSLAAQALLSFKRLENWYFWIAADVIYIPLYASQGLVLTAVVYVVFLGMCLVGLREWRASMRRGDPGDGHSGPGPVPAPAVVAAGAGAGR